MAAYLKHRSRGSGEKQQVQSGRVAKRCQARAANQSIAEFRSRTGSHRAMRENPQVSPVLAFEGVTSRPLRDI
eukprot:1856189-Pyramimonas_sp.AAC.1